MADLCCKSCDMSIKALACAKCGAELESKSIDKQGQKSQVCACPNGCGQVKGPECCGEAMQSK